MGVRDTIPVIGVMAQRASARVVFFRCLMTTFTIRQAAMAEVDLIPVPGIVAVKTLIDIMG